MNQWFAYNTHTLGADPGLILMHLFACVVCLARTHEYRHNAWTVDISSLKFIYSDLSEIAIKWTKTTKQQRTVFDISSRLMWIWNQVNIFFSAVLVVSSFRFFKRIQFLFTSLGVRCMPFSPHTVSNTCPFQQLSVWVWIMEACVNIT